MEGVQNVSLNTLNRDAKLLAANTEGIDDTNSPCDGVSDGNEVQKHATDEDELYEIITDEEDELNIGNDCDNTQGTGIISSGEPSYEPSVEPKAKSTSCSTSVDTTYKTPEPTNIPDLTPTDIVPDSLNRPGQTKDEPTGKGPKDFESLSEFWAWSKQFSQELYDDIHAKKYGIFDGTSDGLYQNIMDNVTFENVDRVLRDYSYLSEKTLIDDIFEDGTLSKQEKGELAKYIVSCKIEAGVAKYNIYASDLEEKLDETISNEIGKKSGSMETGEINKIFNEITKRELNSVIVQEAPNGLIDEDFSQGSVGDCWLLASIKSLTASPKGLQILNDSIKLNEDGSVDVTLKGANKTYNITGSELVSKYGTYSSGDADVRAIEIAVDKYLDERPIDSAFDIKYDTVEEGGQASWAFEILTGQKSEIVTHESFFEAFFDTKPIKDATIENIKNPDFVCTVARYGYSNLVNDLDNITAQTQDGKTVKLVSSHAYNVVNADDVYVYLVNPWDTATTLQVTRKDFKRFFNRLDGVDLSKE